jgi:hypothetical protein
VDRYYIRVFASISKKPGRERPLESDQYGKMGDETIGLMVVMMELFPVCLRTKLGRFVS